MASTSSLQDEGQGSSPSFSTMKWLLESNRLKHLLYAIPIGAILTILCVIGVASGMEFKDRQYGGKWDWLDWAATIIGGTIGQTVQIGFVSLFS